jgi:YegS/Rv2252/BmrU family lipid kinase
MVILNPSAGRGAGARLASQIEAYLAGAGLDYDLQRTAGPGHAVELARDAALQKQPAVIAVGGDGTFNEVLNGLLVAGASGEDTALGVVPIGTGNDFAYSAGLHLELEEACHVAAGRHGRFIDVGSVKADNEERRFFGNGVGIGFDAAANIESRKIQRLRGTLLYVVAVLRTLAFYYTTPNTEMHIEDTELVQPCLLISAMNGTRVGGGFYVTPSARMDDGLLDLCIAAKVSRLKMLAFVPRFMRGTHITDRDITMAQGRVISISSDLPWAAHVDGEVYGVGAHSFEIALSPGRLHLLCPP